MTPTNTEARSRAKTPQLGVQLPPSIVAARLGVPESTLTDWRFRKKGPPWTKLGRLVRYPEPLLDAWLAEQLRGAA